MNKFKWITLYGLAAFFLLMVVATNANPVTPQCTRTTTLAELTEEVVKQTDSTPTIYKAKYIKRMVDWYNREYKRNFTINYARIDHFLLVRTKNAVALPGGIVNPGHYIALVLYKNGCLKAWPISPNLYNHWKASEKEAGN